MIWVTWIEILIDVVDCLSCRRDHDHDHDHGHGSGHDHGHDVSHGLHLSDGYGHDHDHEICLGFVTCLSSSLCLDLDSYLNFCFCFDCGFGLFDCCRNHVDPCVA